MTLYETLGVPTDADEGEIKRAFRKAASENHPDRGGDADKMAAANRAYEVLADPERRKRYDQTGEDQRGRSVEEEARAGLVELFASLLPNDGDPVKKARTQVAQFRSNTVEQKAAIARKREKLLKRRDKVRTKPGVENLVHMIIDQQVRECGHQIAALERALRVHALVLAMLEAYESDIADPPSLVFRGMGTSTTWTA